MENGIMTFEGKSHFPNIRQTYCCNYESKANCAFLQRHRITFTDDFVQRFDEFLQTFITIIEQAGPVQVGAISKAQK